MGVLGVGLQCVLFVYEVSVAHFFNAEQLIRRCHRFAAQVTVKATDLGQPPLVDLCTFRITVEDMNDNAPVFGNISYSFHLSTQAQINVPYFIISASDEDVGSNSHLTYSLVEDSDGLFGIIPDSGLIFLSQRLEPVQMVSPVLVVLCIIYFSFRQCALK